MVTAQPAERFPPRVRGSRAWTSPRSSTGPAASYARWVPGWCSSPDEALLRLDAGEQLHNHLGGPRAAAIFGLGETTAFVVLLEVFGDLVEAGAVPLVKSAEIAYSGVATGPLLATGRLVGDDVAARASLGERGVAVFPVEVAFTREQDGGQTAVMTAQMALTRFSTG